MKNFAIQKSIDNKRLKLTLSQMGSHYGIVIAFFIPYFVVLFIAVKDWITGTSTTTHPDFQYVIIGGTLLGFIAFLFQRRQLKFVELDHSPSDEKFQELLSKIENKEDWHVIHKTEKVIIIKTRPKWTSGSWGEQVTILRNGKQTLVNSICDPDNISSVFSAGRNSSNVKAISDFLKRPIANKI